MDISSIIVSNIIANKSYMLCIPYFLNYSVLEKKNRKEGNPSYLVYISTYITIAIHIICNISVTYTAIHIDC